MIAKDFDALELGPVRQLLPVRRLTTQEEWQATDTQVRERIRQKNRDLRGLAQFTGPESCADSDITAANDQ